MDLQQYWPGLNGQGLPRVCPDYLLEPFEKNITQSIRMHRPISGGIILNWSVGSPFKNLTWTFYSQKFHHSEKSWPCKLHLFSNARFIKISTKNLPAAFNKLIMTVQNKESWGKIGSEFCLSNKNTWDFLWRIGDLPLLLDIFVTSLNNLMQSQWIDATRPVAYVGHKEV